MTTDAERALRALVQALTTGEEGATRLEMIEDALALANTALGEPEVSTEELAESLETLAIQVLVDGLERHNDTVQRIAVVCEHGDENAAIVVTTDPTLAQDLDQAIEDHAPPPPKVFDIN
jgi:hypothetical protein